MLICDSKTKSNYLPVMINIVYIANPDLLGADAQLCSPLEVT